MVALSQIGTVYYIAVVDSVVVPTSQQIISGTLPNIDPKYYRSGSVEVTKMEYASTISSFVNVTNLHAQATYKIYFTAKSAYGDYSGVEMRTFTTLKVNEGVSILIPCLGNVSVSRLLDVLSVIIPVAKKRLIFTEAEEFPIQNTTKVNLVYGDQLNGYRVTLAPDADNNTPSPLELANGLLTEEKQKELEALIPQFYKKVGVKVTPVKRISPRVIVTPQVGQIGYYSATVNIELIEVGRLFAIATEKTSVGNIKPTSYQIAYGLMADNTQLDDRYHKSVFTSLNGNGQIVFDELKDHTEYNVYITAGNDIPYMPADLLSNDKVMQVSLRTLKNPSKICYRN